MTPPPGAARYRSTNRSLWDGWSEINARSALYDVEGFRAGGTSLKPVEIEELGPVEGRSLLHLQCHFGLDTLSWARRGARVTGVDFSERAIERARALSTELGVPARFVCCDVLELDLPERFDVVFASYGVVCWIGDLARWARVAASHLAPGGVFYLLEFHPVVSSLGPDGQFLAWPYFHSPQPDREEQRGCYSDPAADFRHTSYQWSHGIGEVLTPLLDAGLELEYLHEFPYSTWNCFPFLERLGPDRYGVRGAPHDVPMMFSIRARKPPDPP